MCSCCEDMVWGWVWRGRDWGGEEDAEERRRGLEVGLVWIFGCDVVGLRLRVAGPFMRPSFVMECDSVSMELEMGIVDEGCVGIELLVIDIDRGIEGGGIEEADGGRLVSPVFRRFIDILNSSSGRSRFSVVGRAVGFIGFCREEMMLI